MSFHIIHILQHASHLSIDRGCLVLKTEDKKERRAPLSDILAVIVAARGISFSADCLSAIIKKGGIILHCDENYRPIGKTVGAAPSPQLIVVTVVEVIFILVFVTVTVNGAQPTLVPTEGP